MVSARGVTARGGAALVVAAVAAGLGPVPVAGAFGSPAGARVHAAAATDAEYTVEDASIVEASGIAVDPDSDTMFVIQDAGTDDTSIYALSPTGATAATITVPGVDNEDWEDVAIGPDEDGAPSLYVGDIGDANRTRTEASLEPRKKYSIIRVAKPSLDPDAAGASVAGQDIRRWRFVYADGRSHNAESLLVHPDTGRLFVIDKTEDEASEALLWGGPPEMSTVELNTFTPIAPVPVTGASGAAFSPDGDRLVVRNADTAFLWDVVPGGLAPTLDNPPTTVALPPQRQGEGIDFVDGGQAVVVNSEGANQPVYRVPVAEVQGITATRTAPTGRLEAASNTPTWALPGLAAWAAAVIAAGAALRVRRLR